MYGGLSEAQEKALAALVAGRVVTDLGAGDCEYARKLLDLGAQRVVAVDKAFYHGWTDPRVELVERYFRHFEDDIDLAFVAWPVNWPTPGLVPAMERASQVVYLGKTTDGSMCGWDGFWRHLWGRSVLSYHPAATNSLVVYGGVCLTARDLLDDEKAAIATDRIIHYGLG